MILKQKTLLLAFVLDFQGYEYLIPGISRIFLKSKNIKVLIFNAKGPERKIKL